MNSTNSTNSRNHRGLAPRAAAVLLLVLAFSAPMILSPTPAQAANKTFTGPGNFSDSTKWNSTTLPVAGDVLRINGACTFDNAANNLAYSTLEISRGSAGSSVVWPSGGTNTLNVTSVITGTAGAGSIDMTNGGTLQIRTSWTSTNTTLTGGTGTVIYNSTTAQTVGNRNYNNLTFSGAHTTTSITINGAVGIAGALTNSATFSSGNFILTGSTFTFNGSGAQTIPALNTASYVNMTIANTSDTVSLGANINMSTALIVNAGATLNLSTYSLGATTDPTSVTLYCGATTGSSVTGSGTLYLGGNVTVTDATTGTAGASISAPVALVATRTFTVANDGTSATDLTIGGVVSGAAGVTKAGAGTMVLSGSNTYTGTTIVSAGLLKLGAAGSGANTPLGTTGTGTSVTSGAALDLSGYTLATSEALSLNGTGISSGGALTNSGSAATYSGAITFATAASIVGETGTIAVTGTPVSGSTGITLGGSAGGSVSTVIAGARTVTKAGTGTWTLSGASTYSGATTISAGTLKLGASTSVNTAGPLGTTAAGTTVASGAALDLNGYSLTSAATEALSLNGTGVAGLGALTNGSSSAATYIGVITFATAASIVGETGTIAVTGTPASGTTGITLGGSAGGSLSRVIAGARTVTKEGTGTWTLSGANTYSGLTTISAGTLQLGASSSASSAGPLGTTGAGTTVDTGAALDLNGFSLTSAATEALTLNGTGMSSAGALRNSSGTTATTYVGAITLGSASSIGTTSNITLGGGITGGYDLTKVGAATLALGSATATLGALTISAGALTSTSGAMNIAGDFSNSGTFTHNSGTVNLNGSSGQAMTGATTFYDLTLNNASGLTINNDETVSHTLTLTSGKITTASSYSVIIASGGNVSGAGASNYIVGKLQKAITGTGATTFEVGTSAASNYAPISVTLTAVTGSGTLTATSTTGQEPNFSTAGIDSAKYVNRYWTLSSTGISSPTYNATFTFLAGDVQGSGNTSNFIVRKYSSGWSRPASGTTGTTSTSTTAGGFSTSFGNYAIGEPPPWLNYADTNYTAPVDPVTTSPVYLHGTGLAYTSYNVAYYDASEGAPVAYHSGIAPSSAVLNDQLTLSQSWTSGAWHVLVQLNTGGFADISSTAYATAAASPDAYGLVADRGFSVNSEALPEFPTAAVGPFVLAACFAIYYWRRKKATAPARAWHQ